MPIALPLFLLIVALILALLASFNVPSERVNLHALAFACLVAAVLFGGMLVIK